MLPTTRVLTGLVVPEKPKITLNSEWGAHMFVIFNLA